MPAAKSEPTVTKRKRQKPITDMKNELLQFRVTPQLKAEFSAFLDEAELPASLVLRKMLKDYLKKNHDQNVGKK